MKWLLLWVLRKLLEPVDLQQQATIEGYILATIRKAVRFARVDPEGESTIYGETERILTRAAYIPEHGQKERRNKANAKNGVNGNLLLGIREFSREKVVASIKPHVVQAFPGLTEHLPQRPELRDSNATRRGTLLCARTSCKAR